MRTKEEYKAYQVAVDRFLGSNQVRPGCYDNVRGESFFSWRACECCGSKLGGTRETYKFVVEDTSTFEADICMDCVQYLAYGRLDDLSMMEIFADKLNN